MAHGHRARLTGARTASWGAALGEQHVTNEDLAERLATSDDWIRSRTGIGSRWIGGSTTDLAVRAGKEALAAWSGDPADIDMVILATTTPDQQMPASASTVQAHLGLDAGAFDLNAACSGFVYGLITAGGLVAQGSGPVLLIGADAMSTIVDWKDRSTAVLFGDAAGAAVVEPVDGRSELRGWDTGSDGTLAHLLAVDHGAKLTMDGKELFRQAVRAIVESTTTALTRAGMSASDIDLFVPHQANERIITAACTRLGIGTDRVMSVLGHTGNTSAASIPVAMTAAIDTDRVRPGDTVVISGFGAGMSWASAVLHWS